MKPYFNDRIALIIEAIEKKLEFNRHTFADWERIDELPRELEGREIDYPSDSGSQYWFTNKYVYRKSDHWGYNIGTCTWLLDGNGYGTKEIWHIDDDGVPDETYLDRYNQISSVYGRCKWEDFRFGGKTGVRRANRRKITDTQKRMALRKGLALEMANIKKAQETGLEDRIIDWAYERIIEREYDDLDEAIEAGISTFAEDASDDEKRDVLDGRYIDVYDIFWHDIFLEDSYYVDDWVGDLRRELEYYYDVPEGYATLEDYINDDPIEDEEFTARRRHAMMRRK